MNVNRILATEYLVSLGMVSWAAIKGDGKNKFWPWPPTIVLTSIAYGILGLVAIPAPRLAGILGTGFFLAQLMRAFGETNSFDLSGIPKSEAFKIYNEKVGIAGDASYYRILTF